MKRFFSGGIAAAIAAAAMLLSLSPTPAEAQAPGGSYLQTCRQVQAHGNSVSALCRRADGGWSQTSLGNVNRCDGGLANSNGQLTCNMGGRHGSDRGPQRHQGQQHRDQGQGYGSSQHGQQGGHWYGR